MKSDLLLENDLLWGTRFMEPTAMKRLVAKLKRWTLKRIRAACFGLDTPKRRQTPRKGK